MCRVSKVKYQSSMRTIQRDREINGVVHTTVHDFEGLSLYYSICSTDRFLN